MASTVNWKAFFLLLSSCLFSIVCVIPYVISVQGETLQKTGYPFEVIFAAQFIQSIILFSITIFFGLFFSKKIGFQLPLIMAVLEKKDYKKVIDTFLLQSISLGVVVAVSIYVLDSIFTLFGAAISTHQTYAPAWQTLLAAFYGGIAEEVLLRLFLMTFFIWSAMKIFRTTQPSQVIVIVSIVVSAIIFGLGHLPITASIAALTPLVILRAVILNGIGGVVFGWLFWKKGLEAAMIAHFTTDIVLLTILPLLV